MLVLCAAAFLFVPERAARPAQPTPGSKTPARSARFRPGETFLDSIARLQAAPSSSSLLTSGVAVAEGTTTAAAPTTIPAWLAGPATGTVMGIPLPLSLDECVKIALRYNFGLQSSARDVAIAYSNYRQERFEFVPFVDLFANYEFADSKTGIRSGSGLEKMRTHDVNVGVQVQQNLPTGGDITVRNVVDRTRTWARSRIETVDPLTGRVTDVSRDAVVSHAYENSLDITARQPLLRGGGLGVGMANLRLARISRIETELNDGIRRRDLALSVIRTYFQILQRQLDARVSLDAIRERKRFYDETVIKHELGEIAESEIWRAKILWLQEQQHSRQLQQSFLDSLDSLLVLMGVPLETPLRLREFAGTVVDLADLGLGDPDTCVREALANRPEILLADLAIRSAEINVEVARNATLPFLDLKATYTDDERGAHLRDVNDLDDSRRWSIGTLFDLPLPNVARREALRRAKLRLEKARIARQSLEREITQEVRNLYRSLQSNRARIDILAETVALAERSLQLENARFYYGENTSVDVRNAQDDLFQARRDYNNALLRYQSDLASLYRALGWELYREPTKKKVAAR